MLPLVIAAAAALVGIVIGFVLRGGAAKAECARLESGLNDKAREVAEARAELGQAQAESAARAGFEALAAERAGTITQQSADLTRLRDELRAKTDEASAAASSIAELNARLEAERRSLPEKLQALRDAGATLSDHFRRLAGDVLKGERATLSEGNTTQIDAILKPLKNDINAFRDKVEKAQIESSNGVTKLETLIGSLSGLNQQLAEEARNLSTALRGSAKAQGNWGEFILRDLLEKAGLREGEQYTFQQRFTDLDDEDSRQSSITDVVISLPGGRHLIIDSKVSLNAYVDSVNSKGEDEREEAIKRHVASVRAHVSDLASKSYQELSSLETLGFVVMFVPVEPAFFAAIKADERIWSDAYQQKVLLVGPSTLLFVIRMIYELWAQEEKAQNYREILDRGTKLYDKFVGFLADLDDIGGGLQSALRGFEGARNKLIESDTSLVRQVERLRELGVSPKVKKKGKKATLAVIPKPWLNGTVADDGNADGGNLELAASSEDEEVGEAAEMESVDGD